MRDLRSSYRHTVEYRPFFKPLLKQGYERASCADLLAITLGFDLMIVVTLGALTAFVAAGEVGSARLFFGLMAWGSGIVLIFTGALWVLCNLIAHVAAASAALVSAMRRPKPSRTLVLRHT